MARNPKDKQAEYSSDYRATNREKIQCGEKLYEIFFNHAEDFAEKMTEEEKSLMNFIAARLTVKSVIKEPINWDQVLKEESINA